MAAQLSVTAKKTFRNIFGAIITTVFPPVTGRNAVRLPNEKPQRDYSPTKNVFDSVRRVKGTTKFVREAPTYMEWNDILTSPTKSDLQCNVRQEQLTNADLIEIEKCKLDVSKATTIKLYWASHRTVDEAVELINQEGFRERTVKKYYKIFNDLEKEKKGGI
jgi:hypothetical protein